VLSRGEEAFSAFRPARAVSIRERKFFSSFAAGVELLVSILFDCGFQRSDFLFRILDLRIFEQRHVRAIQLIAKRDILRSGIRTSKDQQNQRADLSTH
jgi:hypothetical protein